MRTTIIVSLLILTSCSHTTKSQPEGLDRQVIDDVIHAHRADIRQCYASELRTKPATSGRINTHFVIGADGRVEDASILESTLGNKAVEDCILAQIKGLSFPAPNGGGTVKVEYPFVFKPR